MCVCLWCDIYLYVSSSPSQCGVCVCVCVCLCVCAVQSIFESILEYLSIYLSIYLRMYLSICSWSLPCRRCLCWSLPFVCVCVFITAVPMKKLFAWGDWCVCVCLLIILHLFWVFAARQVLLLNRCWRQITREWVYFVNSQYWTWGYEDRIHFGRILEELWVVWTRIESIIWSLFTVKVIDHRFRFLQSILSP